MTKIHAQAIVPRLVEDILYVTGWNHKRVAVRNYKTIFGRPFFARPAFFIYLDKYFSLLTNRGA